MQRLVLIDGNAILHRAFHALPPTLTAKDGTFTNAVYGFVAMLLRVITELRPTHIAVAFDRPKPTFRKEIFKDYQAQRPEMDDKLVPQIATVHEVLIAMKIPIYEKDGFEADDVIASLVRQASEIPNPKSQIPNRSKISNSNVKKVDEIVIVTGDRDLLQLVNGIVKLYMPVKGLSESRIFGEKEAEERMGVRPAQIPDFKALAGDASDNYPGVAGIGPKTAASLLKEFGSVERIYKRLQKIRNPVLVEKLTKDKDIALLSHKLATIVSDVPIKFESDQARVPRDLLTQEVIEMFGKLGFKTLLKRMSRMSQSQNQPENQKPPSQVQSQMELF